MMAGGLDQYRLEGTTNLDTHPCLDDPETCPGFAAGFEAFKQRIADLVDAGEGRTFYKFGYGDYLFLTGRSAGSAAVGFRALSRPYDEIGHQDFVAGAPACDHFLCEIYPEHSACFREVFGREPDFPAEYAYAAVASRWVFRRFAGRIGLIGADRKIDLIRRLMEQAGYRAYLGLERFEDLVSIPQNFACDDLSRTERIVADQLVGARSSLFLVGIGHVKSGLLHRLRHHHEAVYLDVGQGIDAIAGIVDTEKPFFGGWRNHRLDDPACYAGIDYLSYLPFAFVNQS